MENFIYSRKIHFADTDSAGVVYFSRLLSICHEAYEEILASLDVKLDSFFRNQDLAIPIIHAEIDFYNPLFCGDVINIQSQGNCLSEKVFEVNYLIKRETVTVAKAMTRHICINPNTRETKTLPDYLQGVFSCH